MLRSRPPSGRLADRRAARHATAVEHLSGDLSGVGTGPTRDVTVETGSPPGLGAAETGSLPGRSGVAGDAGRGCGQDIASMPTAPLDRIHASAFVSS